MLVARVVEGVLDHLFLRWPEWVLSGATMICGWLLLRTEGMFASSPAFDMLAMVAPQAVWGILFCVLGVMRLVMLAINGSFDQFPWSPHCRAVGAFLNCFLWFSVAISLLASGPPVIGMAVYPAILLIEAANSIRAASEAGDVGRRRRNGNIP